MAYNDVQVMTVAELHRMLGQYVKQGYGDALALFDADDEGNEQVPLYGSIVGKGRGKKRICATVLVGEGWWRPADLEFTDIMVRDAWNFEKAVEKQGAKKALLLSSL